MLGSFNVENHNILCLLHVLYGVLFKGPFPGRDSNFLLRVCPGIDRKENII